MYSVYWHKGPGEKEILADAVPEEEAVHLYSQHIDQVEEGQSFFLLDAESGQIYQGVDKTFPVGDPQRDIFDWEDRR